MNRSVLIILTTIGYAACVSSAYADNVLYCSEEIATGFKSTDGRWKTSDYVKERYTLKFNDDFSKLEKGLDIFECRAAYSANFEPNLITCFHSAQYGSAEDRTVYPFGGLPKFFYFDKSTLKFVFADVSTDGFVRDGRDSDNLNAGKCETF